MLYYYKTYWGKQMEQTPIIRPRNFLFEFIVIIEELLIIIIWWLFLRSWIYALLAGIITYLALAWTLRLTLQRHHRKGMKLMCAKQFSEAADAFKNSFDFFQKHSLIDRFRFITMFASSAIPYKEMALNNLGICYLHMNENKKALNTFLKLAEINPKYPYISQTIDQIKIHINESQNQ